MFRVLLFKFFSRIETWELLCEQVGVIPSWEGCRFASYNQVLPSGRFISPGQGQRVSVDQGLG